MFGVSERWSESQSPQYETARDCQANSGQTREPEPSQDSASQQRALDWGRASTALGSLMWKTRETFNSTGAGGKSEKINLHDKAQYYDKKLFLALLFSLIMKIKQTCHIERKFLLWLRKNNNIVVGFLDHLALFITEFPVTFDIVICGLWSLEMVKLIS